MDMKTLINSLFTVSICFLVLVVSTNELRAKPLSEIVEFASIDEARILLHTADEITDCWSQFDIDSRLKKKGGTKDDLLAFTANQAREWTESEKSILISILEEVEQSISKQSLQIDMPNQILLIKSTVNEEGKANGYTRSNYIVLKDNLIERGRNELKKTLIHELFHILTRHDSEFRREAYEIIGFKLMNEIVYPDVVANHRITNPDAARTDSYINVKVRNQQVPCTMVLYSNRDYNGGVFFEYVKVGFLRLTDDSSKSVHLENNGKPKIYSMRQIHGFFEQVGRNTQYTINPEEILAENFVFVVLEETGLPNQKIVSRLRSLLQGQ